MAMSGTSRVSMRPNRMLKAQKPSMKNRAIDQMAVATSAKLPSKNGPFYNVSNNMKCLPFAKPERVNLTGAPYKVLVTRVYESQNWTCAVCHKVRPLTPHHMLRKSSGGEDIFSNIIGLCVYCHQLETDRIIVVAWENANERTVKVTRKEKKKS